MYYNYPDYTSCKFPKLVTFCYPHIGWLLYVIAFIVIYYNTFLMVKVLIDKDKDMSK